MGACCSTQVKYRGRYNDEPDLEEKDDKSHEEDLTTTGPDGAIIRLQGSSTFTSMYTRQGKKGTNQDAMTVWENFKGEKNAYFCGVFDGHGPQGHRIARYACENLPAKLSSFLRSSHFKDNGKDDDLVSLWENSFVKAFAETDEDLCVEDSLDSYCSGTTSVTVVKQGEHLMIANLGDSRAVLCTRDDQNHLIPIQLTTDLKPSLPSEAERIKKCGGRVFSMEEESHVPRVWMPNQDCPGLAMSRAFGDFCLKVHGLISTPQVSHRRITSKDEFVVLATDGVWDVLTNNEVIRIVASVKKRSMAAKLLVYYAVQAWRTKYPGSKVDDIAVVCLFLKKRPLLSRSLSEEMNQHRAAAHLVEAVEASSSDSKDKKTDEGETVINCDITVDPKALDELNRVSSQLKRSRLSRLSQENNS